MKPRQAMRLYTVEWKTTQRYGGSCSPACQAFSSRRNHGCVCMPQDELKSDHPQEVPLSSSWKCTSHQGEASPRVSEWGVPNSQYLRNENTTKYLRKGDQSQGLTLKNRAEWEGRMERMERGRSRGRERKGTMYIYFNTCKGHLYRGMWEAPLLAEEI